MGSADSPLAQIRRKATQTIRTNDQAISGRSTAATGALLPRSWGKADKGADEVEQGFRLYPPGPQTYDLTSGDAARMPRADISHLRPGDTVIGQGAIIRTDDRGAPVAKLRPGYENGRSAARVGPVITPPGPAGVSVDDNIATASGKGPLWFRQQVPDGAPWDYKLLNPIYEAFGNYNYGATGRAIPFPTLILDQEAGRAQVRKRNSQPGWGRPGVRLAPFTGTGSFGDDPVDQYWIGEGVRYHDGR